MNHFFQNLDFGPKQAGASWLVHNRPEKDIFLKISKLFQQYLSQHHCILACRILRVTVPRSLSVHRKNLTSMSLNEGDYKLQIQFCTLANSFN